MYTTPSEHFDSCKKFRAKNNDYLLDASTVPKLYHDLVRDKI